jgi:hypothetical protein
MNARQMIELLNRSPFEPIEIHLTNGTVIAVEHPYLIATAPGSSVCTIYGEVESEPARFVAFRNIVEVKVRLSA